MKVLYVDLEREWRGGQSQALLTMKGLHERGHRVDLVAAANAPLEKRTAPTGIAIHRIPRLGLRAWAALKIKKLIGRHHYDVIHVNEAHALTAAWMANAHAKLPLLISRRIGFPLWKNRISRARYNAVTRFVSASEEITQTLIDSGMPAEKISIVNEGVVIPPPFTEKERADARRHFGITDNQFLFGCVGVFVPEKAHRHLIEALAEVRKTHPEARLILAGDGECRSDLESLTKRLGQREAVLFPGFIDNVGQVYAAVDVFAFPSEYEGLGTSLLVALATGLPVISTACGSLGEVVDHERTGLIAEPAGPKFAAAMTRYVEDSVLREKLGKAARAEAEKRFSVDRMVENTIRTYEEVIAERAR
jgi:L-malate glycosyltransferase